MSIPPFRTVRQAFQSTQPAEYTCLVKSVSSQDCDVLVRDQAQLTDAKVLLKREPAALDHNDVAKIVNCLVCRACQENTYREKSKVKKAWQDEFPGRDITQPSSPCPNSLSRPNSRSRRRSSAPRTPTTHERPSAPPCRSTDSRLEVHVSHPEARVARHRSGSAPNSYTELEGADVHSTESSHGQNLHTETVANNEGSPRMPRSRHSSTTPALISNAGDDDDSTRRASAPSAVPHQARSRNSTGRRMRPRNQIEGFSPGDSATWAAWMTRVEVRALVLEPMPRPTAKGTIYAIEDPETLYVKIGITTGKVHERKAAIGKIQHRKFDQAAMWHLPSIPYVQLLRLEALVHADLAFFQRNFCVKTNSTYATHREWFEVPFDKAQQTIQMWWDILEHIGLEAGAEPHIDLRNVMCSSPIFNMAGEVDESLDAESLAASHADHDARIRMWKDLLLTEQTKRRNSAPNGSGDLVNASDESASPGHGRARSLPSSTRDAILSRWIQWSLIGYAVIWALPGLLGLSSLASDCTRAVMSPLWGFFVTLVVLL